MQPLLRGAGRDIVLATLTQAERDLLANVRAFERFRRGFYLTIATGRGAESGVRRTGAFLDASVISVGGLGQQATGFLGLLQDQLEIQNQEENVARLRENVLLLDDTLRELLTTIPDDQEAIPRQRLQVAQAKQALLRGQNQLVAQQATYQTSIDTFLQTLGLPPYLCVEIRDPLLDKFQLISPELKLRRNAVADIRTEIGAINTKLLEFGKEEIDPITNVPQFEIQWSEGVAESVQGLNAKLPSIERLLQTMIQEDLAALNQDIEAIRSVNRRTRTHRTATAADLHAGKRADLCVVTDDGC